MYAVLETLTETAATTGWTALATLITFPIGLVLFSWGCERLWPATKGFGFKRPGLKVDLTWRL